MSKSYWHSLEVSLRIYDAQIDGRIKGAGKSKCFVVGDEDSDIFFWFSESFSTELAYHDPSVQVSTLILLRTLENSRANALASAIYTNFLLLI